MLQNLLTTTVSSADVMMLSYVSQDALSAVSLAGQIQFVLNLFFSGLTIGTVTMCSQYWGNRNKDAILRTGFLALKVSLAICAIFAFGSVVFPEGMMRIFTNDAVLIAHGSTYLRIVGVSYLFMGVIEVYLSVLKGIQQVGRSVAFASVTLLLNIFLNAVLIFGWFGMPKLGVAGVAYATTFSRFVELALCAIDAFILKRMHISKELFAGTKELKSRFAEISMPAMAEGLVWGGATAVLSTFLGRLGSDIVAANSVGSVIKSIATVVCFGLASGGTILLGEDLGQGKFKEAESYAKTLVRSAFVSGCAGCVLMLSSYPLVVQIVSLNEQAEKYLWIMFIILSGKVILSALTNMLLCGVFAAGGDTRYGLIIDAIVMWGFSVLPGFLTGFVFGAAPIIVYISMQFDEIIKLPFVIIHYRKKRWLKNITIEEAGGKQ